MSRGIVFKIDRHRPLVSKGRSSDPVRGWSGSECFFLLIIDVETSSVRKIKFLTIVENWLVYGRNHETMEPSTAKSSKRAKSEISRVSSPAREKERSPKRQQTDRKSLGIRPIIIRDFLGLTRIRKRLCLSLPWKTFTISIEIRRELWECHWI